jgi:hypothetical protein
VSPKVAEDSFDSIGAAVQIGRRPRHFRVLTDYPLFHQIYGRLVGGQSSERIAAWLLSSLPHNDSLGAGATNQRALARRLRRLGAALPDGAVLSQGYLDQRFKSLDAGVDALAELDALIRYQKERLDILAERERATPRRLSRRRRRLWTRLARRLDRADARRTTRRRASAAKVFGRSTDSAALQRPPRGWGP